MELTELRDQHSCAGLEEFCATLVGSETVMVEIGCYAGESTAIFARAAKTVFAIDPWDESYTSSIKNGCANEWVIDYISSNPVPGMAYIEALFDHRLSTFPNVVKLRQYSSSAIRLFSDRTIDLVYIDSIHTYDVVTAEIQRWLPKIKLGGVIAGHDYDRECWPEVVDAVDETFGTPHHVFNDTSWAVRLR